MDDLARLNDLATKISLKQITADHVPMYDRESVQLILLTSWLSKLASEKKLSFGTGDKEKLVATARVCAYTKCGRVFHVFSHHSNKRYCSRTCNRVDQKNHFKFGSGYTKPLENKEVRKDGHT